MTLADSALVAEMGEEEPRSAEDGRRLEAMARDQFQFIWRSLRRLGVREAATDDAAQKVFEIATRRLATIRKGAERAFLFNTAVHVAIEFRRRAATTRETTHEALEDLIDPGALPDEATERRRRRETLDALLDSMPMDLRSVFVLYELEGLDRFQIAELLELPSGTAASRLRRAREHFQAQVKRLRAKQKFSGDGP